MMKPMIIVRCIQYHFMNAYSCMLIPVLCEMFATGSPKLLNQSIDLVLLVIMH